jgi:hypothetical protein
MLFPLPKAYTIAMLAIMENAAFQQLIADRQMAVC